MAKENDLRKRKRITVFTMRKKWVIRYDEMWRDLMGDVARKMNMPVEDVERINTAWWKYVGEMMGRADLPTIIMMYFVKLKPSPAKLLRYCRRAEEMIENVKIGAIVRGRKVVGDIAKMEVHLKKLYETQERLEMEREILRKNKIPVNRIDRGVKMMYNRVKRREEEKNKLNCNE